MTGTSVALTPVIERLLRSLTNPTGGRIRGVELVRLIDAGAGAGEVAPVFAEHAVARGHLHGLASSSLLGTPRRSARLVDSISHVGIDIARTVAIHWACGALDGSRTSLPVGYWEHAVATASAARALSSGMKVSPARVVAAGLIHDVGRALLQRTDPARYQRLSAAVDDEQRLVEAEERSYACDHTDISSAVLRHFGSDADLVDAVRRHHRPASRRRDPLTVALAAGTIVADALPSGEDLAGVESRLVASGFGFVRADRLIEQVKADIEGSAEFLHVA